MPSIAADTPPRTTASSLRTTRSWHAPTRLTTTTLPPSHERFQPPVASTAVRHWRPEDRDGLGTPDDRIRPNALARDAKLTEIAGQSCIHEDGEVSRHLPTGDRAAPSRR